MGQNYNHVVNEYGFVHFRDRESESDFFKLCEGRLLFSISQLPPSSSHLAARHCPTHETVLRSAFYSIFGAHSVCLVYLVIVTNFAAGCPCDELEPGGGSTSHWYYLLIMLIMAMMLMIMVMVIMIMIFMLKICFEEQLGRLSSAV